MGMVKKVEPQNIFITISCVVFACIAFIIPKKIKLYENYATASFAVLFGLIVDTVLAVKYELYVLDSVGIQIPALIGQIVLYAATSIIILNTFPYQQSSKKKIIYIIFATIVTLMFEALSYKFGFIKYNGWKFLYSAISYPFLIPFLVIHLNFFRWIVRRSL